MVKYVLFLLCLLSAGGAFGSTPAASHSNDSLLPDFNLVKYSDPRLTGYNAAGLHILPADKTTVAEVSFLKENGDFVDYYQSENSSSWSMGTESFLRVGRKTVLYGQIEYRNFAGKQMGGSVFINPDRLPFDLVEYADSTRGNKSLEQYSLIGAACVSLNEKLRLGAKIDYLAANYTKVKDLRHKTTLMDMTLTAGLSWQLSAKTEAGANYLYRRGTESVMFGVYGNTDQLYYTLVSYGAFYGKREVAGDTGYTSVNDEKPLFDEYHGGSVQVNHALSSRVGLFGGFTYLARSGYYGVRSPSSVVYSAHDSDIFEYRGGLMWHKGKASHRFDINLHSERLANYENIYKQENDEGGNKDIIYYDKTKMMSRDVAGAKAEYEGYFGVENFNPRWRCRIVATYIADNKTVSVYPYFRKQVINRFEVNVLTRRNFFVGRNVYSIEGGLMYGEGNGTESIDATYTDPTDSQSKPAAVDYLLHHQYEYLTAKRAGASLKLRFAAPVQNNVWGYVELGGALVKGFDLKYIAGDSSSALSLKVGCLF